MEKMDGLHKITKWIDYNRYKAAAALIAMVVLVAGVGCQSTTESLRQPGRRLTRDQYAADVTSVKADIVAQRAVLDGRIAKFNAEVTAIDTQIVAGVADLDRQDQIKAELFNLAGSAVSAWTTGGVSTEAVVGTGITAFSILFGLGSAADGRRKDKIIADSKPT